MNKVSKKQILYILFYAIATILEVALLQGLEYSHVFELFVFPLTFFKMSIQTGILLVIVWILPRIMIWLIGYDIYTTMFNDVYIYLITRDKSINQIINMIFKKCFMFAFCLFAFKVISIYVFTNILSLNSIIYLLLLILSLICLLNLTFLLQISFLGDRAFTYILVFIVISILFSKKIVCYDNVINIIQLNNSLLTIVLLFVAVGLTTLLLYRSLKNREL